MERFAPSASLVAPALEGGYDRRLSFWRMWGADSRSLVLKCCMTLSDRKRKLSIKFDEPRDDKRKS